MGWLKNGYDKVVGKLVGGAVNRQINKAMLNINQPNRLYIPKEYAYRQEEYRVWNQGVSERLLYFYHSNYENMPFASRNHFWQWVYDREVIAAHYPFATTLKDYLIKLVISGDVEVELTPKEGLTKSEKETSDINARINELLEQIQFQDYMIDNEDLAVYSGSVATKIIVDPEYKIRGKTKLILETYPKERFEINGKYGQTEEIVFKDNYFQDNIKFTLNSIYGYGYIRYELLDDLGKKVPLDRIPQTKDLKDIKLKEGLMLAIWMKNRSKSSEFPDLPYGGSDFEGIIDLFHSIDEIYSTMMLYFRRTRPIMWIDEAMLPVNAKGDGHYKPKEYQYDMNTFAPSSTKGMGKEPIQRDNPTVDVNGHLNTIKELSNMGYQKVGASYVSIGAEGVGANQSGTAINKLEKPTIIMRDTKIKRRVTFLKELIPLLLHADDLLKNNGLLLPLKNYDDWEVQITFPEYNGQTFAELVKEKVEAINGSVMDIATAVDEIYGNDKTEEQKAVIVRNIKIEKGLPILSNQMVDDEGNVVENTRQVAEETLDNTDNNPPNEESPSDNV